MYYRSMFFRLLTLSILIVSCTPVGKLGGSITPTIILFTNVGSTVTQTSSLPQHTETPHKVFTVTPTPTLFPLRVIDSSDTSVVPLARIMVDSGAVALSSDRRLLLSADRDLLLRFWDIHQPSSPTIISSISIPTRSGDRPSKVSFRDQIIAIGTADGYILYFDLSTNRWHQFERNAVVLSLTISSNGGLLVAGWADGYIEVWNTDDHSPVVVLQPHELWVTALCFSQDDSQLATGSSLDGNIKIWDTISWQLVETFESKRDNSRVEDVEFSSDGDTLISLGSIESIYFSDSGSILRPDGILTFWDNSSGESISITNSYPDAGFSLTISPNGDLIATGHENGDILIWDVSSREVVEGLYNHSSRIVDLEFSIDGSLLVSHGLDNVVYLWGLRD